jgi:hypothetical protein
MIFLVRRLSGVGGWPVDPSTETASQAHHSMTSLNFATPQEYTAATDSSSGSSHKVFAASHPLLAVLSSR